MFIGIKMDLALNNLQYTIKPNQTSSPMGGMVITHPKISPISEFFLMFLGLFLRL